MELISEGQRREETLRIVVGEESESGLWRIELNLGGDEFRYRALYDADAPGPVFDPRRFARVEVWENGWLAQSSEEIAILETLRAVERRVTDSHFVADSILTVGEQEFVCRAVSFDDSTESVQRGETVSIRIVETTVGHVWLCDDLPLGGYVRYVEERSARKHTEFAGRSFAGDVERTRETWTLVSFSRN